MNSEKEIIALKEEQRMALASNAMECLHQNLCDAGCSKEQIKLCMELSDKGDRSRMLFGKL
jgi:hypothetical protein